MSSTASARRVRRARLPGSAARLGARSAAFVEDHDAEGRRAALIRRRISRRRRQPTSARSSDAALGRSCSDCTSATAPERLGPRGERRSGGSAGSPSASAVARCSWWGCIRRSSRLARRFRWPTLVFNPRAQFERLRADGRFERLRGPRARARDRAAGHAQPEPRRLRRSIGSAAVLRTRRSSRSGGAPFAPMHAVMTTASNAATSRHRRDRHSSCGAGSSSASSIPEASRCATSSRSRSTTRRVALVGRTIDYANTIYLTTGPHAVFQPQPADVDDRRGHGGATRFPAHSVQSRDIHDSSTRPPATIRAASRTLARPRPYGIAPDAIPTTLNVFMNVVVAPSGELRILPPSSSAGDYVLLRAEMDSSSASPHARPSCRTTELQADRRRDADSAPDVGDAHDDCPQHAHRRSGMAQYAAAIGTPPNTIRDADREPAAHGTFGEPQPARTARRSHRKDPRAAARRRPTSATSTTAHAARPRARPTARAHEGDGCAAASRAATTRRAGRANSSYACRTRWDQK